MVVGFKAAPVPSRTAPVVSKTALVVSKIRSVASKTAPVGFKAMDIVLGPPKLRCPLGPQGIVLGSHGMVLVSQSVVLGAQCMVWSKQGVVFGKRGMVWGNVLGPQGHCFLNAESDLGTQTFCLTKVMFLHHNKGVWQTGVRFLQNSVTLFVYRVLFWAHMVLI